MDSQDSGLTVRDALPSEDAGLSILYTNAFIDTWNHNWFAQAPTLPFLNDSEPLSPSQFSRRLFYAAMISSARRQKATIRVVVSASNEILGCAIWYGPGNRLSTSLIALWKTGFLRLLLSWGLTGYRRINHFEAEVERLAKEAFAAKGNRGGPLDAAYLALIATHVEHQKKGVAGYLLRDGAKRFEGLPLLLEATMANAVRVYEREGYEVVGEGKLAPGEVDGDGCLAGKKVEEGLPLYVMVKW